jgi:hypothetical protein
MKSYSNLRLILFGCLLALPLGVGVVWVKKAFHFPLDHFLTGKLWVDLFIEAAFVGSVFLLLRKVGWDGFLLKKK